MFCSNPVTGLREEMDGLFRTVFGESPAQGVWDAVAGRAFPAIDVWEDDRHLYAEAEVPGLNMDELEILVTADELTIKGRRKDAPREGVSYYRRERNAGEFSRTLQLPVEINADKVEAGLRDGVLTVTLPKAEAAVPRKIHVKSPDSSDSPDS